MDAETLEESLRKTMALVKSFREEPTLESAELADIGLTTLRFSIGENRFEPLHYLVQAHQDVASFIDHARKDVPLRPKSDKAQK